MSESKCCPECVPCEGNGFPCTLDPPEDTCCSSCDCHPDCLSDSKEPKDE